MTAPSDACAAVHAGWVRATAILLRGLERLELAERERAETTNRTQK